MSHTSKKEFIRSFFGRILSLTIWFRYLLTFSTFNFFLASLRIERTMDYALPKQPIYQFKPVQQRRQQYIELYCPNEYTVGALAKRK